MRKGQKLNREKHVRVIPEYRAEIDVRKLCKVLILAAKDLSKRDENIDAGDTDN